ncbi:hypothetical protein CX676_18950 [Paracoccus zhejiangensis]|uniref:DUF3726 domain-containing protein n=1 Tax=Paracoccus zhejiangensis TaxID=1077935 RepID=A0A2H5F360_9RHOB|nr:hypothetical protein CX676_18950 [Paracoccus zhejiangensis]
MGQDLPVPERPQPAGPVDREGFVMAEPNDPTRSGPPLPDAGMVSVLLSRNEVEALATKAARGAGMDWGQAEEAGFALGWLTARCLGCTAQLLEHLRAAGNGIWFERSPLVARGQWQAAGRKALCPVALGAALCDHAGLPEGLGAKDRLTAGPVSWPVLLLPFLATLAGSARADALAGGDGAGRPGWPDQRRHRRRDRAGGGNGSSHPWRRCAARLGPTRARAGLPRHHGRADRAGDENHRSGHRCIA